MIPPNSDNVFEGKRILVACNDYHRIVESSHLDSIAEFMYAASDLILGGVIDVVREKGTCLDLERSKIAWRAANPVNKYTHLFFYDADMTVTIDNIVQLLSRNVPVVSGTYFMRGMKIRDGKPAEEFPCVASRDGVYITRDEIARAAESNELIEVHGIGAGSLLVTSEALRDIGSPAFKFDWHIGGNFAHYKGEDQWFADRAMEAGYKVWMDPKVIPYHFSKIRVGFQIEDLNGTAFHTPTY